MKTLLNILILEMKLELIWWINVFGISDWKILQPENVQSIKKDLRIFISCLLLSIPIASFICFGIETSYQNNDDAIFWWTTGMLSAMVFFIFGKFPNEMIKSFDSN